MRLRKTSLRHRGHKLVTNDLGSTRTGHRGLEHAAPTGVTVVKKKPGKLKVKFTAGATNGSSITGYRASCTSSNGGVAGAMT
jgi:hypothetical protein